MINENALSNGLKEGFTFKDLSEWYFSSIGLLILKENTYNQNRYIINYYILPEIGKKPVNEIRSSDIDKLFCSLMTGQKLSPSSVIRIKGVLSPIFGIALKKGIIMYNPMAACTPPRVKTCERHFADRDECKLLLRESKKYMHEQLARAVEMLIYTGIRSGELTALHWHDVDFKNKVARINCTLYRSGKKTECTSPKTSSSIREVALSKEVLALLKEQKEYCNRIRLEAGEEWKNTGTVFINRKGGYLNGQYLNNEFKRMQRKLGASCPLHIHDLRHANASILINAGVPLKVVSEHLGHTSTQTTEMIYTHIFKENKKMTADVISKSLS